ncbi:unnamed protein product [Durusdinium trenchii]|uniref:C2H2-type domain-containing protein n=1 Tax=Durusdinium trenchii TaxID=1381693 RepID=A0ABP0SYA7_9DINO
MAGSSTWSAGLLGPCYRNCGQLGEFYFVMHCCGAHTDEGLLSRVALCQRCIQEGCPFCGHPILERDVRSVTDKLPTLVTESGCYEGNPNESAVDSENRMWLAGSRYPLLPQRNIWLTDEILDLCCTSCGKTFTTLHYVHDYDRDPVHGIHDGGQPFVHNDITIDPTVEEFPMPPKSCDCGGWLQSEGLDIRKIIWERFQEVQDTLLQQRVKQVCCEPSWYLTRIASKLKTTDSVQQLLEFPELFQVLNAMLPTFPYTEWAERFHCDAISVGDAFLSVAKILCAVAAFCMHDIYTGELNDSNVEILLGSRSIVEWDPKYAQSVFGKLVFAMNFPNSYLEKVLDGWLIERQDHLFKPAFNLFKVLGYRMYTWEAPAN